MVNVASVENAGIKELKMYHMANTKKKSLNYDPALILWIEKELKKNGDLVFDTLTKDQLKQWQRYERERP